MTPDDAQTSLDDIRRLQDRTRDEYVRHGFSRPYMLASALALFIAFASFDLPAPHTVAAAALALTTLMCAKPARRVFASMVRR
jgi:hypothetical protein